MENQVYYVEDELYYITQKGNTTTYNRIKKPTPTEKILLKRLKHLEKMVEKLYEQKEDEKNRD